MTAEAKYELLCRSEEYLTLAQTLGSVLKRTAKRNRPVLRKGVLDTKTMSFLKQHGIKKEAALWIQRAHGFREENVVQCSSTMTTPTVSPPVLQPTPLLTPSVREENSMPPLAILSPTDPPALAITSVPTGEKSMQSLATLSPTDLPPLPIALEPTPLLTPSVRDPTSLPTEENVLKMGPILTYTPPLPSLVPASRASPISNMLEDDSTLFQLLATSLSSTNLHCFSSHLLQIYQSNPAFLRAHTIEKSFVMILAAVRSMCGGQSLSRVCGLTRGLAKNTTNALQDISSSWGKLAHWDRNQTETFRLQSVLTQRPAQDTLSALYLLHACEKFNFLQIASQGETAIREHLTFLIGFALFTLILARPLSRPGVVISTTISQLEAANKQVNEKQTVLFYERHKTMKSFGSLACSFSPWAIEVIQIYLSKIREVAVQVGVLKQSELGDGLLFPRQSADLMDKCLKKILGHHNITSSLIRSSACEYIGTLGWDANDEFSPFSSQLQSCAAHDGGGVLLKHYTLTSKLSHEELLVSFINARFILPAEQVTLRILRAGHGPNVYEFDQPVQRKRKKRFSVTNATAPEQKPACRNRANSKRCASYVLVDRQTERKKERKKDREPKENFTYAHTHTHFKYRCLSISQPTFSNANQAYCDKCVRGFGGSGSLFCSSGETVCYTFCSILVFSCFFP